MLNEVQMHSQARNTPQLLMNGNHWQNEGEIHANYYSCV